jgi:hypothetical protein
LLPLINQGVAMAIKIILRFISVIFIYVSASIFGFHVSRAEDPIQFIGLEPRQDQTYGTTGSATGETLWLEFEDEKLSVTIEYAGGSAWYEALPSSSFDSRNPSQRVYRVDRGSSIGDGTSEGERVLIGLSHSYGERGGEITIERGLTKRVFRNETGSGGRTSADCLPIY